MTEELTPTSKVLQPQFRVIEVNGIKMEVDLSTAKVITNYKVGDAVKLLKKEYSTYESFLGIIVGFDNFKDSPTIIIAYIKASYGEAEIKFEYYNKNSENTEITTVNKWDLPYTKSEILEILDREIIKQETKVRDLKARKKMFLNYFGKYFDK